MEKKYTLNDESDIDIDIYSSNLKPFEDIEDLCQCKKDEFLRGNKKNLIISILEPCNCHRLDLDNNHNDKNEELTKNLEGSTKELTSTDQTTVPKKKADEDGAKSNEHHKLKNVFKIIRKGIVHPIDSGAIPNTKTSNETRGTSNLTTGTIIQEMPPKPETSKPDGEERRDKVEPTLNKVKNDELPTKIISINNATCTTIEEEPHKQNTSKSQGGSNKRERDINVQETPYPFAFGEPLPEKKINQEGKAVSTKVKNELLPKIEESTINENPDQKVITDLVSRYGGENFLEKMLILSNVDSIKERKHEFLHKIFEYFDFKFV